MLEFVAQRRELILEFVTLVGFFASFLAQIAFSMGARVEKFSDVVNVFFGTKIWLMDCVASCFLGVMMISLQGPLVMVMMIFFMALKTTAFVAIGIGSSFRRVS